MNACCEDHLIFVPVSQHQEHYDILFERLRARRFNISHKQMPDYAEHVEFVKNHPYRNWFLIKANDNYIGSFYIHFDNVIGFDLDEDKIECIFPKLFDLIKSHYSPLPPVRSVRSEFFCIHVAYHHVVFKRVLQNMGLKINQVTYILDHT